MKTSVPLMLAMSMIMFGCKKSKSYRQILLPPPVVFVIVNQQGESLIHSKNDAVSITCNDQGEIINLFHGIAELHVSATDSTKSEKYNGLCIGSNDIRGYSTRQSNPVKTFDLSLNGSRLGTIYFDCEKLENGSYNVKDFTFNDQHVTIDSSVVPSVAVLKITGSPGQ